MKSSTVVPAYLKKGEVIGIVCPAGYMPYDKMQTCIGVLRQWGYKVKLGKTAGHQFHYFSGTDEERLADLQMMLDDAGVRAILCARGGYGISRIVDSLDFGRFRKNPKWLIGYSDVTVLHTHIYSRFNIATIHSPMAAAFNDGGYENEFVQSLRKILKGNKMQYKSNSHRLNRYGTAKGELVGGNLSLLTHLTGSASDINTDGKILFLEDAGEYIYHIDRMMLQLKRSGKLSKLAGLIIGGFTELKDTQIPFGQEIDDLIFEKVKDFSFPVCFNFPVSHTDRNYALKVGIKHQLSVTGKKVVLQEINQ